jgi:hypothetical protein
MGLLDDAIREHLDLKRRRGADPGEIAREENEALGPVRRAEPDAAPAEQSPHADHEDAGFDEPLGYDDEPPPAQRDHPVPSEPPQTHEDPYAETEAESATPPHGDPLLHQPTREFSSHELDEALGAPDAPAERPAPAEREAPASGSPGEGDGEDEDVLEETPDFLQETPEHDRLWFEQKPPKDFDF